MNLAITVNGQPQAVAAGSTLSDLLDALGTPAEACATAVNGAFVARAQRAACVLSEGDAVFTFQPITGG